MAGNQQHLPKTRDFSDPFNAGQMVGMLVILTFIENNDGIPKEMLESLKQVTATNAQEYLQRPTEDVFLLVDNLVKEIK